MLNGLLSNSPPQPLSPAGVEAREGEASGEAATVLRGSAVYSTLLTSKGRMITDLRISSDPGGGFLLEIPSAGFEGAVAHFKKFLPPRLAAVEDRTSEFGALTLLGPETPGLLVSALSDFGLNLTAEDVVALEEGEELVHLGPDLRDFRIIGSGDAPGPGWDLLLPMEAIKTVRSRLEEAGGVPLSDSAFEVLRIEKGRPVFGKDMDEETIPVEAGIQSRAIDNEKGCYTGQEVIIRIRDRGHVNKELRGLLLRDAPLPVPGLELFHTGKEKSVGWITSSVASPHFGQTVALGYLQRLVRPGDTVRLADSGGPLARVVALSDRGWVLD
jgi:folate-binding protein YgfZ